MEENTSKNMENAEGVGFDQLISNPQILDNLVNKMAFSKPTPIQEATIPAILEGRDIYAGAKTGSGKTVAFLAPIAQMLLENKIKKALILSPVRELALQIDEEAMRVFGEDQSELMPIPLYGGVPLDQQLRALKANKPRLYVATPGRMMDFINEGCIDLNDIDLAVLDEADRMCDMGFAPQVTDILKTLPKLKQVLMFSATLPEAANKIMQDFLTDPYKVQVDRPDESSSTIDHTAHFLSRREKFGKLKQLLDDGYQSTLIFVRTRKGGDRIFEQLKRERKDVGLLHAGFSMGERERTIKDFREGKIQHLVATDVAARGLDVDSVNLIIHYELPEALDDYIHRSGRSGRAGRRGFSMILIDKDSFQQRRQVSQFAKSIKIEFVGANKKQDRKKEAGPRRENNKKDNKQRRGQGGKGRRRKSTNRNKSQSSKDKTGPSKSRQNKKKTQTNSPKTKTNKTKRTKKKKGLLSKTKKMIGRVFGSGSKA